MTPPLLVLLRVLSGSMMWHKPMCSRTAGFVVDPHTCFRACIAIQNRMQPTVTDSDDVENRWPGLIASEGYPTVSAALLAHN